MTERTEQVGADQIGDAAWQERGALLEVRGAHLIDHPQRKRGLMKTSINRFLCSIKTHDSRVMNFNFSDY